MNKLAEKIINKIKHEKIQPTSRWKFVLKDSFFWLMFVLAVGIGGLTVSIILNTLLNNDWDLYLQLSGDLSRFIVLTLPYFWLILLGVFLAVAYWNVHNTKKAYKHSLKVIMGGVALLSCLLGLTFYNFGLASSLDKQFIQKLPPRFHQMMDSRLGVWQKPAGGFLIGEIQNLTEDGLELKDFEGQIWQIDFELIGENSFFSLLHLNEKVRIMGQLNLEKCGQCFSASVIRPLGPPQEGMPKRLDKLHGEDSPGMMKIKLNNKSK